MVNRMEIHQSAVDTSHGLRTQRSDAQAMIESVDRRGP